MKKLTIIVTLVILTITSFALPTFASDGCDATTDHLTLGRELFDVGNHDDALAIVDCGLNLNPDNYALYMLRAVIYCNTDRIELAIEDMTTAIDLRPGSAYAYNNRGWANFRLGNYEESLANLNYALELDGDLAYAYNNRGLVYQMQGDYQLAHSDFQTAIDLGLNEPWAAINLYNLEFELDRLPIES
ncbi:MAG: tetratricopeptide repeat protein [Chloroflexota bacterium]